MTIRVRDRRSLNDKLTLLFELRQDKCIRNHFYNKIGVVLRDGRVFDEHHRVSPPICGCKHQNFTGSAISQ